MAEVRIEGLSKRYGSAGILRDISLDIADGAFVVLVGPSGCGKSTLLRLIAGLDAVTSGEISMNGRRINDLPPARRGIAMVFQSYALYPHMTAYRNMAFGLEAARLERTGIDRRVREAARILQLEDLLERRPAALSGGERQRVAIGRAIVREPELFLFDEPLSNLDAALRVNTRLEIARLHRLLGATILYVTHDQAEAMTLADKIVVMNNGRIEQTGTPMALYDRPANLFVAGFIGSPKMNFITGAPAVHHNAATLGIRPEHLKLGADKGTWRGSVVHVEHLGSDSYIHVDCADAGTLTVREKGDTGINAGAEVWLTPRRDRLLRFDDNGNMRGPK